MLFTFTIEWHRDTFKNLVVSNDVIKFGIRKNITGVCFGCDLINTLLMMKIIQKILTKNFFKTRSKFLKKRFC